MVCISTPMMSSLLLLQPVFPFFSPARDTQTRLRGLRQDFRLVPTAEAPIGAKPSSFLRSSSLVKLQRKAHNWRKERSLACRSLSQTGQQCFVQWRDSICIWILGHHVHGSCPVWSQNLWLRRSSVWGDWTENHETHLYKECASRYTKLWNTPWGAGPQLKYSTTALMTLGSVLGRPCHWVSSHNLYIDEEKREFQFLQMW